MVVLRSVISGEMAGGVAFVIEKELEMNERGVQSQIRKLVLAEEEHGSIILELDLLRQRRRLQFVGDFAMNDLQFCEVRKCAGGRILLEPLTDASRVCASLVTASNHSPLLSTSVFWLLMQSCARTSSARKTAGANS